MEKQQLKKIYEQVYDQCIDKGTLDTNVSFERKIIELKLCNQVPDKFEYIYSSELEPTITEAERNYSSLREILVSRKHLKSNNSLRDLYDQDLIWLIQQNLNKLKNKLNVSEFINVFNIDVENIDSDSIILASKFLTKNSFEIAYKNHDQVQMLYMLNINNPQAIDFVRENIGAEGTCDCLRVSILNSNNKLAKQMYISSFSQNFTNLRLIEDLFLEESIRERSAMLCSPEVMSAMCKFILENELYKNVEFLKTLDRDAVKHITFETINLEYKFFSEGINFFKDISNLNLFLSVKQVYSNYNLSLFAKYGSDQVRNHLLTLIDNNILNDYPIDLTKLATEVDIDFLSQIFKQIRDSKQDWNQQVLNNICLVKDINSTEFFIEIYNFVCEDIIDSEIAIRNLLTSKYSDERCRIIDSKYFEGVTDNVIEIFNSSETIDKRYIELYLSKHASEIKSSSQIEWLIKNYPKYLNSINNYHLILDFESQKIFEYKYIINYSNLDADIQSNEQIVIRGYINNFEKLSEKVKGRVIDSISLHSIICYAYDMPAWTWQDIGSLSIKDRIFFNSIHYQTYIQLLSTYISDSKKLERQLKGLVKTNVSQAFRICELLVKDLKLLKSDDINKFLKNTLHLKSFEFKELRSNLFKLVSDVQQLAFLEYGLSSSKDILVEHTLFLLNDYPQFIEQFSRMLCSLSQRNRTIDSYLSALEVAEEDSKSEIPYPEFINILEVVRGYSDISKVNNPNKIEFGDNSIFKLSPENYIELYAEIYTKLNETLSCLDAGSISEPNPQNDVYSQITTNKKIFEPIINLIINRFIDSGLVCDYMAFSEGLILRVIEHPYTEEQQTILQDYIAQICYHLVPKNSLILDDGLGLLKLRELGIIMFELSRTVVIDYYNLGIGKMSIIEYATSMQELKLKSEVEKFVYFKLLRDVSEGKIIPEQVIAFYQEMDINVKFDIIPHIRCESYMEDKQKEANQLVHDKMVDITISSLGKNDKHQRLKIFGINNLVKLLKATKIDKGFNSSWTAKYVANANINGTSEKQFKLYFDELSLSKTELVDLAIHNTSLISYVADYLNEPMIESLVLFFIAHDKYEPHNLEILSKIERFTLIPNEEMASGRVCYEWYMNIEKTVGKEFIYEIRARMKNTRGAKVIDGLTNNIDKEVALQKILNKRNKDMLVAYSLIEPDKNNELDLVERVKLIRNFKQQSKQYGAQRRSSESLLADACIKNIGDVFGISETIDLEIFMLEYQEYQEYVVGISVDEYIVKIISTQNSLKLQAEKDGKLLKSIPAKIKPQLKEIKDAHKELSVSFKALSKSFEQLMITQTKITVKNLMNAAENPLIRQFLENLIFETGDNQFVMFHDNRFKNCKLEQVELVCDNLKVAHITSIINNDKYFEWKQLILDMQIVQPFKQLFREAYFKQSDELEESKSYRYGNHLIQLNTAFSVLMSVGWLQYNAVMYKLFSHSSIRVEVWGFNSWYHDSYNHENSIEEIHFIDLKTNQEMLIKDVGIVDFSEIMRDFDLAVSVAHVGEENRELGLSTVEIRKEILEVNKKLFKLSNLNIRGHKVYITGMLGNYVVNLKSGDCFKEGKGQLILFPVNVKRKKDVYLPYIDKNSKTQEIMSLIILLSRDDKISNQKVLKEVIS